jgi:uncharacterized membrane protein HdeD (DUF308 family)
MSGTHDATVWAGTRTSGWLRILGGLVALAVGIAALAWPEETLRVVAFLFGLNLLLTGVIRGALSLFVPGYPGWYRALGVVFGALIAIIGLFCLRNLVGSLVLLVFLIGVGWLIEGLIELIHAIGARGEADPGESGRGVRISAGVLSIAAALVVLIWPQLTLATFLAIGAILLIVAGIAQVAGGIAGLRAPSGGRPTVAAAR